MNVNLSIYRLIYKALSYFKIAHVEVVKVVKH